MKVLSKTFTAFTFSEEIPSETSTCLFFVANVVRAASCPPFREEENNFPVMSKPRFDDKPVSLFCCVSLPRSPWCKRSRVCRVFDGVFREPWLTATLVLICPGLPFSAVETSCDFEKDLCNFYQDKEGPGWTRVRVKANMYRAGDHTTGTGESKAGRATHPGVAFPYHLLASFQRKIRKEGERIGNNW